MYRHLLVPIDGSAFSASALPLAAALARRVDAEVHLVLVHDPSAFIPFAAGEVAVPVYDAELVKEQRAIDQRALEAEAAKIAAMGARVSVKLLEGTTIEALVEHGAAIGADLTVMTTHGRGGFARVRLGSTATAYLERATTPVLLVHGSTTETPALPTGTVLVPLDGSALAESVLPHARTFAEAIGASLALIAVSVPHAMPMAPFGTELLADTGAMDAELQGREDYLTRIQATCAAGTTTHAVTDLSVGRAILDEATRIGSGAIAIATHGRGGLMRMIMGSVADEIVRHADRPVLVYRPELAEK